MPEQPSMVIRVAANLAELKKNLAEGKVQIETTTAALTKLSSSFQGDRLFQQAMNVTAAVQKIGGASKLTATEQERVNSLLDRALEKYRLMGKEAPAGMQALADATKGTHAPTEGLLGLLTKIGPTLLGAFGIGTSIAAVVQFGRSILADADALVKLHDTTSISIQDLQKLRVVGDEAGNTLQELTSAATMLQKRLATDDDSAVASVRQLGMSFAAFKDMGTYDQLAAISTAVRGMHDPLERAEFLTGLFGRSWATILPSLLQGMDDLKDRTVGMSDESARGLDRVGDALGRVWRTLTGAAAEAAGRTLNAIFDPLKYYETQQAIKDTDAQIAKMISRLSSATALKVPGIMSEDDRKQIEIDLDYQIAVAQKRTEAQARATERATAQEARAVQEVMTLWDQYFLLKAEHGGTSTDIQIAQIDLWAQQVTAAAVKAGTDTREFYEVLAALSKEKMGSVLIDWRALRQVSRDTLQEQVERTRATYIEALSHSSTYSRESIAHFKDAYQQAIEKLREFGKTAEEEHGKASQAVEKQIEKVRTLAGEMITAEEAQRRHEAGGSYETPDLTQRDLARLGGFDRAKQTLINLENTPIHPTDYDSYVAALEQANFIKRLKKALNTLASGGQLNAFATGGMGDFGAGTLAMLHGREAIVPLDRPSTTGAALGHQITIQAGAVQINYPLMTDPRARGEIASLVGDAIMRRLRDAGLRVPIGP